VTRKLLLTLIAPVLLAACGTPSAAGSAPSTSPTATVAATASATPTPEPTVTPAPSPTPTPAPATPPPATPAPPVTASVFVANNMALGSVLVNAAGRTLYYFVPERGGRIACTGPCTGAWPPLFTASMAPTASRALPGQLGVVARANSEQVTYNHWPLYTFAGDAGPDQTNGQGVFGFGGKWFVATPRLQP
jgi:predicted lipoprotein with Yx(FWY)xxD motif